MREPRWLALTWLLTAASGLTSVPAVCGQEIAIGNGGRAQSAGWSVTGGALGLDIRWGGHLVTTYRTGDGPKPYFYPLVGPTGEGLTRGFPMDPHPDEAQDHPHHRSVYFGHSDVNGIDFWSEVGHSAKGKASGVRGGTTKQVAMSGMQVGKEGVVLRVRNEWLDDAGKKVAEDGRTYRLGQLESGEMTMDWDITVLASEMDLLFGDNKDGLMAFRVIPGLQVQAVKGSQLPATGRILNSEGGKDGDAWGKRARWIDYSGIDRKGNAVGIAMFDHPENLRHPTWWHAREYGLCAANPFGIHHFEKQEGRPGEFTLPKGQSLRLRYRLLLHRGAAEPTRLQEAWQNWANQAGAPSR